MLVAIHQPHYLPWLRYFEKVARADVFILLDNVQFSKNGWQNRNNIKGPAGEVLLTVPVHAHLGQRLDTVAIDNDAPWRKKHWRTIHQHYARAKHFRQHAPFLEETYARPWKRLNELNAHLFQYLRAALGVDTQVFSASQLSVNGSATERLVSLVKAVGGTRYYTGAFALETYLEPERFADAGIGVEIQNWQSPRYPQLHGDYLPDLSILDLLMNCGPEARAILCGAARQHGD